MSSPGRFSSDAVFQFQKPKPGPIGVSVPSPRLPVRSSVIPKFIVRREPRGYWGSFKVMLSAAKVPGFSGKAGLLRDVILPRSYFRGLRFSSSLVLHCAAIALLIFLPRVILVDEPELETVPNRIETIYYLPERHVDKPEPKVAVERERPAKKPTESHGTSVAIKLPHPEAARKGIVQAAAPVVRVTSQTSLPELLMVKPVDTPKVQFQYNANAAKPMRQQRNVSAVPVPTPTAGETTGSGMVLLSTSTKVPILPLAVGPTLTSHGGGGGGGGDIAADAPSIGEGSSPGGGAVLVVVGAPSGPPGGLHAPSSSGGGSGSGAGGGSFSVSSSGGGGVPGGSVGVSAGGGNPGSGGTDLIASSAVMNMVYAVPPALDFRRNSLIVSAGPIGGGGLAVYGALHCGKVDTVFLPMPGKNWTMQYCPQQEGAAAQASTASISSAVVHLQQGIVPPQAESRFDFQRLPIPPNKQNKMIILKGMLRGDGTVADLQVYQSIVPLMDEAARVALSRWKFKPAMREGAPIPVQILVGIPMQESPSRATP